MSRKPRPVPGKDLSLGRPGIPAGMLEARVREQRGLCLLCGDVMAPPVVDHDHELARLHPHPDAAYCVRCWRSVVCRQCNWMLGFSRDRPEVLERGAALVREFRARWQGGS